MSVVSIPMGIDPLSGRLPEAVARAERREVRVVLTRDGEPVAAAVPLSSMRALEEPESPEDAHWSPIAETAHARWVAEGRPPGVPMEEIAAELGINLNEDP